MAFQQRPWPVAPYLNLVLTRLKGEAAQGVLATSSFVRICDQLGIPYPMRGRLLFIMVREGYVQRGDYDQISITVAGARLAAAPLN